MAKATAAQLRELVKKQEYRCALTGRGLKPETASCDHRIPISNGGTHDIANIQILHRDVNRAKGTMSHDDFVAMCCEVAEWTQRSGHVGGVETVTTTCQALHQEQGKASVNEAKTTANQAG